MRRTERAVTDSKNIAAVIRSCKICRIGLVDAEGVYIVPMNFGFEESSGNWRFWFHGAGEGRKYKLLHDIAAHGETVGFEMDSGYRLCAGATPCAFTAAYRSVIGIGHVHFAVSREEKRHGLTRLMQHIVGDENYTFPDAALDAVTVFSVEAVSLSCKENE